MISQSVTQLFALKSLLFCPQPLSLSRADDCQNCLPVFMRVTIDGAGPELVGREAILCKPQITLVPTCEALISIYCSRTGQVLAIMMCEQIDRISADYPSQGARIISNQLVLVILKPSSN